MGLFRVIGRVTKPLVNVPKWVDSKRLSDTASYIGTTFKSIYTPRKAERKENYEQAIQRLGLSEQDIQDRRKAFSRFVLIFMLVGVLVLAYGIYLFVDGWVHSAILCAVLALLAFVQVFRYHFWLFQIKQKRLGCSVREWFKIGILGKHP